MDDLGQPDTLDANNPLLRQFASTDGTSAGPSNDLGAPALPPMPPMISVGGGRAKSAVMPYGPAGEVPDSSPQDITSAPTDTSPEGIKRWVLQRIASGEAHSYNTIYTPPGSAHLNTFSSFADHPRVPIPIPGTDKHSNAAGLYQFLGSTWDQQAKKLGLSSFSPDNQDTAAWDLAQTEYKSKTGRDLAVDAAAGKVQWSALAAQWPSLARGPRSFAGGADPAPATASGGQDVGGEARAGLSLAGQGSSGGPVPGQSPGGQNSVMALAMLQGLFPQHKFTPVDYDPYKFLPKLG